MVTLMSAAAIPIPRLIPPPVRTRTRTLRPSLSVPSVVPFQCLRRSLATGPSVEAMASDVVTL